MSYAANIGQDKIIQMLRELGAVDLQHAFDRACLQGKLETAAQLYAMGARPEADAVMGPCETLNVVAWHSCSNSALRSPTSMVIEWRRLRCCSKHILAIQKGSIGALKAGSEEGHCLPDTPPMACIAGGLICWKSI